MEEIKEILLNMQNKMDGMQGQMDGMQDKMDNMQVSFEQKLEEGLQSVKDEIRTEMQEGLLGVKNDIRSEVKESLQSIKEGMQYLEKNLTNKIEEGNQRLAVFQQEITPKINILFDADETRKEKLKIHDSEIGNIKQEQFEHALKINRLEQQVIGA